MLLVRTLGNGKGVMGSAEDEINNSAAKLAKIRPMRVEMYGMNYRQNWQRSNRRDVACNVFQNDQNKFHTLQRTAGRQLD